jgi:prolyl-tRNA editing enzyme YbaK/EbsC (Cys-tRNA(Pro) deacylase)
MIKKNSQKKVVKKKSKTKLKPKPKAKPKLPTKLIKYLEDRGVKHKFLEHRTVYTAMDAAATMKKKINEIAKSLLVKADKDYFLVILPADHNLDFDKLKKFISKLKAKDVKTVMIPGEKIMAEALKLKQDALSAFGQLHKLEVIMEKKLADAKKAIFSSGSYNHSVEMAVKDFVKLENAVLGSFGVKKKVKLR